MICFHIDPGQPPAGWVLSAIEILHQAQGEHFIARLAALIFLLQIARAQD
jgi:hypothetical protein